MATSFELVANMEDSSSDCRDWSKVVESNVVANSQALTLGNLKNSSFILEFCNKRRHYWAQSIAEVAVVNMAPPTPRDIIVSLHARKGCCYLYAGNDGVK